MKEFLIGNWSNILSLVFSAGALFVSIYANHRVNFIHRQDIQETLYSDLQRLLNYKCDYHTAEQKVLNCYFNTYYVSADEEKAIKLKVYRYFGKNEYSQLCKLLDLCDKARSIDFDLKILFALINYSDPQKYNKLKDILAYKKNTISKQEQMNIQNFLSTISFPFYQITDDDPGRSYDYLTLNKQLKSLDSQIQKQKKELNYKLETAMKKR